MSAIRRYTSTTSPQTEKSDARQAKNNAGGYVYSVSDAQRLERFLILGTDGGTYYAGERDLTKQNLTFIDELIKRDPELVSDTVHAVSTSGRAYRNDPAVYVAARFIIVCPEGYKERAKNLINSVCRTSTHIFDLCGYIDSMGGWGQAKMNAVRRWYESMPAEQLKYQVVKYRQRNGWTHRDVFRTVHPEGIDHRTTLFALGKPMFAPLETTGDLIDGFLLMQSQTSVKGVLNVLSEYTSLPWEAIPTQFLSSPEVWKKLFYNGQIRGVGLVRNVKRLVQNGALSDISFARDYAKALRDKDAILKGMVHPIQYLNAMGTLNLIPVSNVGWWYAPDRSSPMISGPVKDSLEAGFYHAFGSIPEIPGNTMIACDVSGSMSSKASNVEMSCAQATACLAMVVARRSENYAIRGFTHELVDLQISASDTLDSAMGKVQKSNFGTTDCAQPMIWAEKHQQPFDTFIVLTDSETWAGRVKPADALRDFRRKVNSNAKLAVVGMTATQFTIADPADIGMQDFVGFDTNAPTMISQFASTDLPRR